MSSRRWSVGMALYDLAPDFFESIRAQFTVMSLLIHHPQVDEVIVVDNHPEQGNPLRDLPGKTNGKVRYIEMPDQVGTSQPRNRVFAEAKNEYVACLDPHVLLYPYSFDALDNFYTVRGDKSPDILHGCMMTEAPGSLMATHMNDQWRAEMLGTWGRIWLKTKKDKALYFSVHDAENNGLVYVSLDDDGKEQRPLTNDEISYFDLPLRIGWSGHERVLESHGCREPTTERSFIRIPGHGMGFWACRKDSWLPFDPRCRGFGGEEITTGKRFRQAGRNAWCVLGCKWWHHFNRPRGVVPYSLSLWNKVRNYVLEFQNLGLDLGPVKAHFGGRVPTQEWVQLESGMEWPDKPAAGVNPASFAPSPVMEQSRRLARAGRVVTDPRQPSLKKIGGCAKTGQTADQVNLVTLINMYTVLANQESPLKAEMPRLRYLAAHCGVGDVPGDVLEIAHQTHGTVAMLSGVPKSLCHYGPGPNPQRVKMLEDLTPPGCTFEAYQGMPDEDGLAEYDLLFLDVDPHTAWNYIDLLRRYAPMCRRYIAIHDTVIYGQTFNGEPGLMPALDQFIKEENGRWHFAAHYQDQHGLIVYSRYKEDEDLLATTVIQPAPPLESLRGKDGGPLKSEPLVMEGPGTELKEILASIGVNPHPDCGCNGKMMEMNRLGDDGCDEKADEIAAFLHQNAGRWSWTEKVQIAARAVKSGLAFKLNPANPYISLVREAVKRSRAKKKEAAK